jgi:hypothetical protein
MNKFAFIMLLLASSVSLFNLKAVSQIITETDHALDSDIDMHCKH